VDPKEQLQAIRELDEALNRQRTDYWIFGGWAVDLHLGRVTRDHADIDVAVWDADFAEFGVTATAAGWQEIEPSGTRGYAVYGLCPQRCAP